MPVGELVTIAEAAKLFNLPRWKIDQWIESGKVKVEGTRGYDGVKLINPDAVRRVIDSMNTVIPNEKQGD